MWNNISLLETSSKVSSVPFSFKNWGLAVRLACIRKYLFISIFNEIIKRLNGIITSLAGQEHRNQEVLYYRYC